MIVSSMSYKEMYDNLAKDKDKVEYRKTYYLPKAIKEFKKARKFPAWKWYDYTNPSTGNQYVVFFYVENRLQIEKPICDSFFVYYVNNKRFIIDWVAILIKQTHSHPLEPVREIRAFSSHFFQRYGERFIKNNSLSSNDVACVFFARNPDFIPIEINEEINNNIGNYNDKANRGFRVRDGFCFTMSGVENSDDENRIDAIVTVFTTFVAESSMSEIQRDAIEKEHWKNWLQSMKEFEKEAKDGIISYTLQ